jgi:pyruvyltransferase
VRKNTFGVWWLRTPDGRENFGDALGPAILKRLGVRVVRVPIDDAEIVACGSVLHRLTNPATAVWGTGVMHPGSMSVRPADVRAVRGALTATCLGVDVPLGDPGLLVSALWKKSTKRHRLGVVPHWRDTRSYPDADIIIDVTQPVDDVIAHISSCATIAASSLHGLIAAESFGLPTMRLPHPWTSGGPEGAPYADHKFTDYLTALGRPVHDIQEDLVEALRLP